MTYSLVIRIKFKDWKNENLETDMTNFTEYDTVTNMFTLSTC